MRYIVFSKNVSIVLLEFTIIFFTSCEKNSDFFTTQTIHPEDIESSSSINDEYPYTLKIHPTIHCKDSIFSYNKTIPIFKCDDGSTLPNNVNITLDGNFIVHNAYENSISEEDIIFRADTSTTYPYILERDTTIYCKHIYKIEFETKCSLGFCYETFHKYIIFKCNDGNIYYNYDDMVKTTEGFIYDRFDPSH